jgi:ATP adenylyltransferase
MIDSQATHPDPTFARLVRRRLLEAKQHGSLHLTRVRTHLLTDEGVSFVVHEALEKRNKPKKRTSSWTSRPVHDPFDNHEPDLFIENLSETHKVLLNKYPVLNDHLLIVTRTFESQTSALTLADFDAVVRIRRRLDALIFYNAGPTAGASQPRKHIQAVALPIGHLPQPLPMWPQPATQATGTMVAVTVPSWPFRHAAVYLGGEPTSVDETNLREATGIALDALGLRGRDDSPGPYNLLLARSWLWVVPRIQERFQNISINALGFAGSLYVKNTKRLERLRLAGPMEALRATAGCRMD